MDFNVMTCRKCGQTVPEGPFCFQCGAKQDAPARTPRKRGNGTGSVYKLPNGKYKAVVVLNYYLDEDGNMKKHTRSRVFDKKKDAVTALVTLPNEKVEKKNSMTFAELYDKWFPTHRASKDTMYCYRSAFKHFAPIHTMRIADIELDDIQECMDNCPAGKRTHENMKALCGLMYKYGIPRKIVPDNLNLAQFLVVTGASGPSRKSFTDDQIKLILNSVGTVEYADYVACMIYLGFRPSEMLDLKVEDYNRKERYLVGGAKTDAGKNRTVTISPKIQPIIDRLTEGRTEGYIFRGPAGGHMSRQTFTDIFHAVLEQVGIDNPIVSKVNDVPRHMYTPHTCRHTFATMMKRVRAPGKDKQALIGHASEEMLYYYQDVDLDDLRSITDNI